MKIHPDGTLEGTAEELAAYQSKIEANKMPNIVGHKPTGHKPTLLGQLKPPHLTMRDEAIARLKSFTGVETFEVLHGAWEIKSFDNSTGYVGTGKATILIVKH